MNTFDHGGDIYSRPVKFDFSICVNPFGMPKIAREAAAAALYAAGAYPDPAQRRLREALAARYRISEDMILPGNGAAELIYALMAALRPAGVIALSPGFSEYQRAAAAFDIPVQTVYLQEADGFAWTDAVKRSIFQAVSGTGKLVFLCNPNNPTGHRIPGTDLLGLLEHCRRLGSRLCIDECFLPFLPEEAEITRIPELERHPQLLILRAFTKIYGMAGLRLGALLCGDFSTLQAVRSVLQPWNVSLPAAEAGVAALSAEDFLPKTLKLLRAEKRFLKESMLAAGLASRIYGDAANFLMFRAPAGLRERLLEQEILIREINVSGQSLSGGSLGPERFYRIGIRTHADNAELLRCWKQCTR